MEYLILALLAALGAVAAWGYSQKRGRDADARDRLRVEDAKLRAGNMERARERKAVEAEAKRAETQAAAAVETADAARRDTADARAEAERIAGRYPRVPAVLLALALAGNPAFTDTGNPGVPPCSPPDVSGIVHALRQDGSELAADASGLILALREMAASSCREADSLRVSVARMESLGGINSRLTGIAVADARAALDALDVYRAEVPRLTARRFGFTLGVCIVAPWTDSPDYAAGPGGCLGIRL